MIKAAARLCAEESVCLKPAVLALLLRLTWSFTVFRMMALLTSFKGFGQNLANLQVLRRSEENKATAGGVQYQLIIRHDPEWEVYLQDSLSPHKHEQYKRFLLFIWLLGHDFTRAWIWQAILNMHGHSPTLKLNRYNKQKLTVYYTLILR